MSGWDALAREVVAEPGVMAIGTIREEDLFIRSTAHEVAVIRPSLDEALATRIWGELSQEGASAYLHWREPLELSKGLMLEYTHILTKGERLNQTIAEQIRRRLFEARNDELLVLRVVSFAASYGAAVDAHRLRQHLGLTEGRFARALQRLVDEHAVHIENDGALGGLHEIRSKTIDTVLREVLAIETESSLRDAAATLRCSDFATFIVGVLRQWPALEDTLIDVLVRRITDEPCRTWISIFHGLGLAVLSAVAEQWVRITRETGIDDRFAAFALNLALADTDLAAIKQLEPVQRAIARFRAI